MEGKSDYPNCNVTTQWTGGNVHKARAGVTLSNYMNSTVERGRGITVYIISPVTISADRKTTDAH